MRSAASVQLPADNVVLVSTSSLYKIPERRLIRADFGIHRCSENSGESRRGQ
jgi:hypothetical protein